MLQVQIILQYFYKMLMWPTQGIVNTVLAGMYCTDMYTGIETLTFHTDLNTGHVWVIPANFGQYRLVPSVPAGIEKVLFYFIF